jgi:hypothetical protein
MRDYKVYLAPKPGENVQIMTVVIRASSVDDARRQAEAQYSRHTVTSAQPA